MDLKQEKRKKRVIICVTLMIAALLLVVYTALLRSAVIRSPLEGKIILLVGDSRSSTDYSFYKEILEKKTGARVRAEGISGCVAAYNASDEYFERLKQPHDFSIWLVGGNDAGSAGSVGTFSPESPLGLMGEPVVTQTNVHEDFHGDTFIQAVDHMTRKYLEMNHGSERMVFCTDLPQQRDSKDSEWSRQENWERKRQAILECCKKNGIDCLDLYMLCSFDMSQEPMFHAPTDTESNNGVYYMDGLHPNPRGIDLITDYELEELIRRVSAE